MKPAVFVDTNIILDLLARREPFYPAAARFFSIAETGDIELHVSSLTFANLFYILRKETSAHQAVAILKKFKLLVTVQPVDNKIIEQALASGFNDFEDAIQYFTALNNGCGAIITRNARDYRNTAIPVCTAEEYIGLLKENG